MINNRDTIKNVIFTHKYILEHKIRWYVCRLAAIILGNVLSGCLVTYLPAYAVRLLATRNAQIFGRITVYIAVLYLIMAIVKRMERTTNQLVNNRRILKAQEYYVALCRVDYESIDSAKFKVKYEAGQESFYDGFHSGFHNIILDFRALLLGIVGLAVYCVLEARVDIWLGLLQVALSSVSLWLSTLQKLWIEKHQTEWKKLDVKIRYLSKESINIKNAKDIRLYKMKHWLLQNWDKLTSARLTWRKRELVCSFLVKAACQLLLAGKYLAVYLLVLGQVKNGLAVDEFVFLIGLSFGINNWVEEIFHNIQYLQMNSIHVRNTREVLEYCLGKTKSGPSVPVSEDFAPEIRMEDVTFVFPEKQKPIFEHFNLTIRPGEKLALVGNNGAGKTTLIKIICGLYRPTSGKLLINGFDMTRLTPEEQYRWCTVMFQDFHLLAATLAENVSCMPKEKTNYRRVDTCLKWAGLAHKAASLPHGLDSTMTKELDTEGIVLSGGELQKLMIARCLYQDRPIIILDEPTAALDAVAESRIYQQYYELTKNKTSIFISHRLNSTKFCDRIILLNGGQIVEEGGHEQLLAQKGEYASMYTMQASYYQEENGDA